MKERKAFIKTTVEFEVEDYNAIAALKGQMSWAEFIKSKCL